MKRRELSLSERRASLEQFMTEVARITWEAIVEEDQLPPDEREARERKREQEEQDKRKKFLKEHEKYASIEVCRSDGTVEIPLWYSRKALREDAYKINMDVPEDAVVIFKARDERWYPYSEYPDYDRTGELPDLSLQTNTREVFRAMGFRTSRPKEDGNEDV